MKINIIQIVVALTWAGCIIAVSIILEDHSSNELIRNILIAGATTNILLLAEKHPSLKKIKLFDRTKCQNQ